MAAIAGVDVGNATTEIAVVSGGRLLAADRVPTRGRKGSAESLRGAAALLRRIERRLGRPVDAIAVAPLRAVDTGLFTIPPEQPRTGLLRVLAAGVATPGGTGACVGRPVWADADPWPGDDEPWPGGPAPRPGGPGESGGPDSGHPFILLVPEGLGYRAAAARIAGLLAAGAPVGAVLAGGDEGVLIANRLPRQVPVIDQVDVAAAARCRAVAVEVRPPGAPLTLLADPIALAAALALDGPDAAAAVTIGRILIDYSNAVVGVTGCGPVADRGTGGPGPVTAVGSDDQPWVEIGGARIGLRAACGQAAGWRAGAVRAFGSPAGVLATDDLFAVDLGAVTDTAGARRGSVRRSALVASLHRAVPGSEHVRTLADLTGRPVRQVLTEPAAARIGALTTPGAAPDALVVDVGAGTIDVIASAAGPGGEVVVAGAGELLTAAVAETLAISRAAADWVKRGACLRVDGGQRFEAEDGGRGFLDRPAPAAAVGMLAVAGPAGLLPFDRSHSPAEWRAIRLRLKQAVLAVNLRRALDTLGGVPSGQVLLVGGPAQDDELLGVLIRALPDSLALGRGQVGGTLGGAAVGCRYAAALGLALSGAAVAR
jgi:hypothetical protein